MLSLCFAIVSLLLLFGVVWVRLCLVLVGVVCVRLCPVWVCLVCVRLCLVLVRLVAVCLGCVSCPVVVLPRLSPTVPVRFGRGCGRVCLGLASPKC